VDRNHGFTLEHERGSLAGVAKRLGGGCCRKAVTGEVLAADSVEGYEGPGNGGDTMDYQSVLRIEAAEVVGTEFIGVSLAVPDGVLELGLNPPLARALVYVLLRALHEAAKSGNLPQAPDPLAQDAVHAEATPSGVHLTFELCEGASRIEGSLTRDQARQLGENLILLADPAFRPNPSLN